MQQFRTEIKKIEEKIKGVDEKIEKVTLEIKEVTREIKEVTLEIKEVDQKIEEVDKELILPRNEEEKLRKLEKRERLVVRINGFEEQSKGLVEQRKGLVIRINGLVEERNAYAQRQIHESQLLGSGVSGIGASPYYRSQSTGNFTNEINAIIQDFTGSNIALRLHSPESSPSCVLSCQDLNEAKVCLLQSVLGSLRIQKDNDLLPSECLDRNVDGFLDLSQLLDTTSESKCQEAFTQLCNEGEDYGLLDGHAGVTRTFCYSRPMRIDGQEIDNVTPLTAKIDLLSSRGPIFLEIKAVLAKTLQVIEKDREVLLQTLTRIYRLRGTYGQLAKFVGFAATSRTAWCFVFSRKEQCDDKGTMVYRESVDIWKITHDDLFHIWGSVAHVCAPTSAANPPDSGSGSGSWFLTPDAPFINSALMKLGYHPSLCGVKLEPSSKHCDHKVYHLTFPRRGSHTTDNTRAVVMSLNDSVVTIKVHRNQSEFQKEAALICQIRDSLANDSGKSERFYAKKTLRYEPVSASFKSIEFAATAKLSNDYESYFGAMTLSGDSSDQKRAKEGLALGVVKEETETRKPDAEEEKEKSETETKAESNYLVCPSLWNLIPLPESQEFCGGGVIVMSKGQSVEITAENILEVSIGVQKSLQLIHAAGLCHCDIRRSNILKFGDGFQLIDYDLSIAVGESFVFKSGALFDNRGDRLKGFQVGDAVSWTSSDDYEMLLRFLLSMTLSLDK